MKIQLNHVESRWLVLPGEVSRRVVLGRYALWVLKWAFLVFVGVLMWASAFGLAWGI